MPLLTSDWDRAQRDQQDARGSSEKRPRVAQPATSRRSEGARQYGVSPEEDRGGLLLAREGGSKQGASHPPWLVFNWTATPDTKGCTTDTKHEVARMLELGERAEDLTFWESDPFLCEDQRLRLLAERIRTELATTGEGEAHGGGETSRRTPGGSTGGVVADQEPASVTTPSTSNVTYLWPWPACFGCGRPIHQADYTHERGRDWHEGCFDEVIREELLS